MQSNDSPLRRSAPIMVECTACGTPFLAHAYRIAKGLAKFCSNRCRGLATPHPVAPKDPNGYRLCDTCGASFWRPAYVLKLRACRFCSRTCSGTAIRQPLNACICERCGVTFHLPNNRINSGFSRFCSTACSMAYVNRLKSRPLSERLWEKVSKNGPVPSHHAEWGNCWLWRGGTVGGYGSIGQDGVNGRAHRLTWEEATGDVLTSNDIIGHTCDVRACVRNDSVGVYVVRGDTLPRRGHLFKGTTAHNIHDMIAKGRAKWQKDASPA